MRLTRRARGAHERGDLEGLTIRLAALPKARGLSQEELA